MLKKNLRRGGYIAPYSSSPNSTEYMLNSTVNVDAINNINYSNNIAGGPEIYVPPTSLSTQAPTTPGIRGGNAMDKKAIELDNVFYYSMDGGCACNAGTSGGSRRGGNGMKKGGDFVLTPFISALALLGARMLADKNSGFNMSELMSDKSSSSSSSKKNGGNYKKNGAGAGCARFNHICDV